MQTNSFPNYINKSSRFHFHQHISVHHQYSYPSITTQPRFPPFALTYNPLLQNSIARTRRNFILFFHTIMADKNLTVAQKGQGAKIVPGAKGNSPAKDRGRTDTRASGGHFTPTTSSTRAPASQKLSPGNTTTTTTTTTTAGEDAQRLRRSATPQPSAVGRRSHSAEKELPFRIPPQVSVGIGKDFWAPSHKPWCKKKAVFKNGKLFQV